MTDLELYQEEQRQILLDTKKEIADLTTFVEHLVDIYVAPKDSVEVTGEVIVNTEKEIAVNNLDSVLKGLEILGGKVTKAIEQNKPEAIKNVTVSNIKDAKADKVAVTNLGELKKEIQELKKDFIATVEKLDLNVNVEKADLPTNPTKPIAVRLSDGKGFYNAVMQAMSGGGSNGIQTNTLVPYKYDSVYLSNYDANNNPQTVIYKEDTRTVATLTITYSGTNITSVVRT